jgi:NitT/TauT family transport system substrate-binding protein
MIGHHTFRGMKTLAFALVFITASAAAQADTKIKLVLNWKYEGPQGMFFLAQDRGYFKQAGLDVTFDQGNGSGAAVPQVANGAYDMGFGDINALIELSAKKPDDAPIGVFMLYNRPPFTIAVKADSPIKTPADFVGRKLGGAANDGALKLFPAPLQRQTDRCRPRQAVALHQIRRLRHGPLLQRDHRLAQICEGTS